MICQPPPRLGTTPKPEHHILVNGGGGSENGPAKRPAVSS